ncbi:Nuclear pore complex protein Nup214 [Sergentomyia squamirostris]
MVDKAPDFIDVTEVQFKLQSRVKIFSSDTPVKENCQLVASASAFGLVFLASPLPELKVIQLSSLTAEKIIDKPVPMRTIPLPSEAIQIAVNCDNTILAVDVVSNGITMIILYSVPSFLSAQVKIVQSMRLSPDIGVRSKQLAWNPTIPNVLAICLENGALSMFLLKEQGFEFHTVDKSHAITSVCWSPKGKQIVATCPNGRLIQFKPDLKSSRVIDCPQDTTNGPQVAVSVQWLSTYQFAVAYNPPCLYVVNAPKSGQISCINYEDICFGGSGPRQPQAFLIHILPWNTLLMASATSMEVGVLATNEAGDAPLWRQWCMLDEARAELPLTAKKQESYPIGFTLETGCTHKLVVGETEIPVMPMIHLLSTDGVLVSFNILNMIQNVPGICSPPRPLADTSGLSEFIVPAPVQKPAIPPPAVPATFAQPAAPPPQMQQKENEVSFTAPPSATSTPFVQQKSKGIFGNVDALKNSSSVFGNIGQQTVAKPVATFGIGGTTDSTPKTSAPSFFGSGGVPAFGSIPPATKASTPPALVPVVKPKPQQAVAPEQSKPLITVPPSYAASQTAGQTEKKPQEKTVIPLDDENNAIIQKMIQEEVAAFDKDLKDLMTRSQSVDTQIGSQESLSTMTKQLRELMDLTVQATESNDSLSADVRLMTVSLNDSFMMLAEAKSKYEVVSHPTYTNTHLRSGANQTNRRQLNKLQAMLANNRIHLEEIKKQIDSTWALHEEEREQYQKDRMRVPKMEMIYQTVNMQKEILVQQQKKVDEIKKKLDIRVNKKLPSVGEVDSLSDSIVSMVLVDQIEGESRKLCASKMKSLQEYLKVHQVRTIHPKRPERKGINSEIVQEKREAAARVKTLPPAQPIQPNAFNFGTTTAPVKVVEAKPAVRPVAKAKPPTPKPTVVSAPSTPPVMEQPAKPIPVVSKPPPPVSFDPSRPFASTASSFFAPKADTSKGFSFGQENKLPQPEVVFAAKPQTVVPTKPSVASPTVAALLTSKPVADENVDVKTSPSSFSFGAAAAAAGIQKTPLGVFNQGNKPPVFTSTTTAAASTGIFGSTTSPASIFSGLPSFGNLQVDKPASTGAFSFASGLTITPMAPVAATTVTTAATTTTTTSVVATTKEAEKKEEKHVLPKPTPIVKETTTSPFDADSLLKNLTFCQPTVAEKTDASKPFSVISSFGAAETASKGSSIFGGSSPSIFNLAKTDSAVAATTPSVISVFSSPTTTTTTSPSIFGGGVVVTPPATTAQSTPTTVQSDPFKGGFGSATSASTTVTTTPVAATTTPTATSPPSGLFSSVIKSDSQPFGSPASSVAISPFSNTSISATPTSISPFGTPSTAVVGSSPFGASGGSMFGSSTGFPAVSQENPTSIFSSPTKQSPGIFGGGGSMFGQSTNQSPESGGSIFGGAVSSSPGSIFGGGAPANSTGSVFGGGSVFGASAQTSPPALNSVFGGDTGQQTSGFGFGQQQQQQPSSVFGSAPPPFGASVTSAFGAPAGGQTGAFAQGGPSVSQTGFGSPNNAFAKPTPTFGSAAGFGGPPAFGSAPTFGGAASFGGSPLKPTGFGTFANAGSSFQSNAQVPQQQNSLFAALGSSDSGMTFGNLAQNNNGNQAKMQFGGSAFSTWRQ